MARVAFCLLLPILIYAYSESGSLDGEKRWCTDTSDFYVTISSDEDSCLSVYSSMSSIGTECGKNYTINISDLGNSIHSIKLEGISTYTFSSDAEISKCIDESWAEAMNMNVKDLNFLLAVSGALTGVLFFFLINLVLQRM